MKRAVAACALSAWAIAALAQSISAPPPPPIHNPAQGPIPTTTQQPQRGNVAPVVDIRIQGDGITLPKGVGEAPPPEKPAEKPPAK